ncbi:MAG: tyrosine-type recombinase/integrase [bacterium]
MKLTTGIHKFFDWYLPRIKGVSENTIKSYRDTFKLFLPFAAKFFSLNYHCIMIDQLTIDLIISFLEYLERERNNIPQTRNSRLATFKSFARMILLIYPEHRKVGERLLHLPKKRSQKPLIGFLTHEEISEVFKKVDLKTKEGFRDYTILHLLYDSGARASEIASLRIDNFDPLRKTITLLGKGNRYRLIELWPITVELLNRYLANYRVTPYALSRYHLFINQRGTAFTRHGIYRLCKKYLTRALLPKRMKELNPAHSFRHTCAVHMLLNGSPITDIKNRLGHAEIQSTMVYLNLSLSRKKEIQKKFMEYTQSTLKHDAKITEFLDWENKEETLVWLDSL